MDRACAAMMFMGLLLFLYYAYLQDGAVGGVSLNGPPTIYNYGKTSDLTIARLPPYQPTVVVDLSVIPNMTNESITNITVRIGENQLQNVTIWKGDEIVAYIPAT